MWCRVLSPRRKSRPVACPFAPFASHRAARGTLPILLEGPLRQPLVGLLKPSWFPTWMDRPTPASPCFDSAEIHFARYPAAHPCDASCKAPHAGLKGLSGAPKRQFPRFRLSGPRLPGRRASSRTCCRVWRGVFPGAEYLTPHHARTPHSSLVAQLISHPSVRAHGYSAWCLFGLRLTNWGRVSGPVYTVTFNVVNLTQLALCAQVNYTYFLLDRTTFRSARGECTTRRRRTARNRSRTTGRPSACHPRTGKCRASGNIPAR